VTKRSVLLTCAGQRVDVVRAFREALDGLGWDGEVVAVDANPLSPALMRADSGVVVPLLERAGAALSCPISRSPRRCSTSSAATRRCSRRACHRPTRGSPRTAGVTMTRYYDTVILPEGERAAPAEPVGGGPAAAWADTATTIR
jgi:hypothetical protein